MITLSIDPGNTHSAYVIYDEASRTPIEFQKIGNSELLSRIDYALKSATRWNSINRVAIEMIASYGMPVGAEVFETCVWIGRFVQAWSGQYNAGPCSLIFRREVKLHLCGNARAKDGNIRQALIDKYGGKDRAIGKKANPGPLYGVSADVWSALAIAVTHAEVPRESRAA